jgi:hypothetical protein
MHLYLPFFLLLIFYAPGAKVGSLTQNVLIKMTPINRFFEKIKPKKRYNQFNTIKCVQ